MRRELNHGVLLAAALAVTLLSGAATLAQEELPKDTEILRTLAQHNRLPLGEIGLYPCAGVYAVVAAPGVLRAGDPVLLS